MNSNFSFNNGMTIQIPPFNAASDQLFLEIKKYFDDRFNELDNKINEIISKNNELGNHLCEIERKLSDGKEKKLFARNSNKTEKYQINFNKRKIFKPIKRKIFTSKLVKTSLMSFNSNNNIKTEEENALETEKKNSFLSDSNNDSVSVNIINNKSNGDNPLDSFKIKQEDFIVRDESLEPQVILNPEDDREIFIGGNNTVKLSFWAYKKCLTCIRGKPNELNSRLCLRLLQAKFGRQYMLSHNYNGSGDKLPIDRVIMQAILNQVKMQFPSQEDMQNNPSRFAMFRDYINNAFRVVAYRHRKGIQSNTPFWDQNGEPITDLDAPTWISDHIK